MEFSSQESLRDFLSGWLEDHGHRVYRQVPSPGGGDIDILTEDYAIDCPYVLNQSVLRSAADTIQNQKDHLSGQSLVVAGLTPSQDWEETYLLADQLQAAGIEVWFVDQMKPFIDYYQQIGREDTPGRGKGLLDRHSPLAGCLISLGIATILGLSFWLAYNILDRRQLKTITSRQSDQAWEQLHRAVTVWDRDTALGSLKQLSKSPNLCVTEFARRFELSLTQRGAEGFRDINPIKRALNQQDRCTLPMQEYDFSP
ncbi:MAG: hypothetical protein KGQ93_00755 [Cyanobacteria bacterium REEB459]|nr:hypothetical protein [Cyanobacteria bacterium REEB459]